jgi:hypothetical protein
MKFVFTAAVLLLASAVTGALAGQQQNLDSVSREVLAAENARFAALDRSDGPALQKILGDDHTYVHASGKIDTKQSIWRPSVPGRFTTFPGGPKVCLCDPSATLRCSTANIWFA